MCFDTIGEDASRYSMACGHCFHTECIVRWAQSDNDMHGTCPVCRFQESQGRDEFTQLNVNFGTSGHAQWTRILKALESAVPQMEESERKLYDALRKDEARAVGASTRANAARKSHAQEYGAIVRRGRELDRRVWANRFKVTCARRNLLSMFPVTRIVIRETGRGERSVGIPRRSSRLAVPDRESTEPTQ